MFCKRNGCESLFYWLRDRRGEASASSVLKQPPGCQCSELSVWGFTCSSCFLLFCGSGITVSYPQFVPCMVKVNVGRHGAVLLSKAHSRTEQSWCISLSPSMGPPACGSVAQWLGWVPQPATVMSKTIQDVIQGLIPPALTHLSLLPLFFLVPNEVRDLWQKASTVAKLLQQHTCVVSCWLFFFPLKYLSNPYISYNAESQDPISLA